LLKDPKNKADYRWFKIYICYWVEEIEELLGPCLATKNHAYIIQSATFAATLAIAIGLNKRSRRPLLRSYYK